MTMSRRELLLRAGWTAGAGALLLRSAVGGASGSPIPLSKQPMAKCAAGASQEFTVFLGSATALPPRGATGLCRPRNHSLDRNSRRVLLWQQRAAKQSSAARLRLLRSDIGRLIAGTDGIRLRKVKTACS